MFSTKEMPSTVSTLFSAYASFAASMMLVRSIANEFVPHQLRSYLFSALHYLFPPLSSTLTLVINEMCGMTRNQVYDDAEVYLQTKTNPSTKRLCVSKTQRQKHLCVAIEKGEEVIDKFENLQLRWRFVCIEPKNHSSKEVRCFELTFNKKFKDKVFDSYLPHVLSRINAIKKEKKVVKLYNRQIQRDDDFGGGPGQGMWGSINLEHPATFDKLAMDPEVKKSIIDDLDRFVSRKEFYKKVGKAWKRGYLLYGPPGTGKSSLVAAMANYLNFDIYDLELSSIHSDYDLREILLASTNRSIMVIEDIDCSLQTQGRSKGYDQFSATKMTLSGLLNFIDGLWSSCGDERIIVFTTNHKDRLDPALLRPGRMDVHINMSYCTSSGFKVLASNYHGITNRQSHHLYGEIEALIDSTEVTPAEVAEELMKSDDVNVAFQDLVNFLKRKKDAANEIKDEGTDKSEDEEAKRLKSNIDPWMTEWIPFGGNPFRRRGFRIGARGQNRRR